MQIPLKNLKKLVTEDYRNLATIRQHPDVIRAALRANIAALALVKEPNPKICRYAIGLDRTAIRFVRHDRDLFRLIADQSDLYTLLEDPIARAKVRREFQRIGRYHILYRHLRNEEIDLETARNMVGWLRLDQIPIQFRDEVAEIFVTRNCADLVHVPTVTYALASRCIPIDNDYALRYVIDPDIREALRLRNLNESSQIRIKVQYIYLDEVERRQFQQMQMQMLQQQVMDLPQV